MLRLLVALQAFQVAILLLHDWVPLGRLNDVAAVKAATPRQALIGVTIVQTVPFAIPLIFSLAYLPGPFPGWLWIWLWIAYALLFIGELRAWWIPYLGRIDPARRERYQAMFGQTHAFLPIRNGIAPNTLHVALHAATLLTLLLLMRLDT